MTYEICPYAPGPLVFLISVKSQGPQQPFELAFEEGRGLTASCVARALGAHAEEVSVLAGAGVEGEGKGKVLLWLLLLMMLTAG